MKNGFTFKQEIILMTVFILDTQKLDKKTRLQFHVEFSKDEITINKMFYELLINAKPDIANMLEETTGSCSTYGSILKIQKTSPQKKNYLKYFQNI